MSREMNIRIALDSLSNHFAESTSTCSAMRQPDMGAVFYSLLPAAEVAALCRKAAHRVAARVGSG